MNLWFAKAGVLAGNIALIAIRAPHGQRSRSIKVAKNLKGPLEIVLLIIVGIGYFLPLVWVFAPVLRFADYPLHPVAFAAGTALTAIGLWLLHRSHADLGPNWSVTLEVRENHSLVTRGIYRRIRHPMYLAFLVFALGQALVLPNWIAGPSYFVTFALLIALRLGPEERMMREQFGADYDAYAARTKRLVPGVW